VHKKKYRATEQMRPFTTLIMFFGKKSLAQSITHSRRYVHFRWRILNENTNKEGQQKHTATTAVTDEITPYLTHVFYIIDDGAQADTGGAKHQKAYIYSFVNI